MHEIVKNIHKAAIAGETIDKEYVKRMIDESFYLPYATKKLAENMYKSVTKAINHYVEHNRQEFANIQMAETDIEIDMGDGIKVNGRIDLVKRKNVDGVHKTYIVDFKTANKEVRESINKEQLKIYALGYQELTGTKADYIEVYQLDSENRATESITDSMMEEVRTDIKDATANIRRNYLPRKCDRENCSKCHFNYLCLSKAEKKDFAIG